MSKAAKQRYARLLGDFWRNPKVRRLSLEARGLLVTAWSYCADHMTNGEVPLDLLRTWGGKRYAAIMAELCRGSEDPGDRPFLAAPPDSIDAIVPGWGDVNITREEWDKAKADEADRKRTYRETKANVPKDVPRDNAGTPESVPQDSLDEEEDKDEDEEESEKSAAGAAGARRVLISSLESRYPDALAPLRSACGQKRTKGKMGDGPWLSLLRYAEPYPVAQVLFASRAFLAGKHGPKGESYFRGILRGSAAPARELPSSAEYAESASDLDAMGLGPLTDAEIEAGNHSIDDYAKGALCG